MRIPRGACLHWLIRTPLSTLVTSDRVKQWAGRQAGRQAGIHADIHLSTPKLSRLAPVRFARPDNKMGTSVLSLSHMLLALPRLIYSRAADVMLHLVSQGRARAGTLSTPGSDMGRVCHPPRDYQNK